MKRNNVLGKAGVLLIVLVICSSLCVANTDMGQDYEILFEEDFTDGNMPPTGDWGAWNLIQTNQNETWYIDASDPHSEPYCGTVHRGNDLYLQDEWLITPSLDFSGHSKIHLQFMWYTDFWASHYANITNLNVSISTDGGSNWTLLWSEDSIIGTFPTWEWIDTNNGDFIDLSDYADETDVKISFRYTSNSTEQPQAQEFSIDDIKVLSDVGEFRCYNHGPYEWVWWMQYNYLIPGVRFHGSAEGGEKPYDYFWNFDGHQSSSKKDPIYFYKNPGMYNVTFIVRDSSIPPRVAISKTYADLFLTPPPELNMDIKLISFGIQAEIENVGTYDATYINWTIVVRGGLQLEKVVARGTIERLASKSSEAIKSGYFFGFGPIHIIISAEPENIPGRIKDFSAFKIGPFVICNKIITSLFEG